MKYVLETAEVVRRKYELDVKVPLATDEEIAKSFDTIVRASAKKGELLTNKDVKEIGEQTSDGEVLKQVFRSGQRIYPQQRRAKAQVETKAKEKVEK